ncbi:MULTISPECIES: RDD family protein [Sphingobacterium]|uniref:RDD family protein n=1 Tax=Sphingobacterium litopenaei TaxID=2763500 RepID=A0ABR7YGK9_9SPHI|nr:MULTISPECIES: RDD family protein [Sphingobacterium]MBD1430458.1 RDD family protein [Sphingobacterium litopenaei]NGM73562.1 RDD family protein [Sphingobacterium sp. SGL-16]
MDEIEEFEFPTLLTRIQSSVIDFGVILIIIFVFSQLSDSINFPDWIRGFALLFVFILYEPTLQTLGGTIGNRIKGINVRKNQDVERKINFFQALIRFIVKVLLGWVSFLTIHNDYRKRAIHDLVAGTVMLPSKK